MESVLHELLRHGVAMVGLNVFLQQIGLPIPAVPTMMVAGALALDGRISGAGVFAISVAASVVADTLWFWAGRRFGYPVLKLLCRLSLSPDACVRQTEGIFERWGFYSLVVSKFVPGFSTVAPPVAGALRMSLPQFLVAAVASAALWVGAAMAAGALFRREIEWLLDWISRHAAVAALALAVLLGAYVAYKAWQRRKLARQVAGAMIGAAELAARLAGDAPPLVVDVGTRLAHHSRPHIPGALLLDLDAIDSGAQAFTAERSIVFYCACPNEASARRAAQILVSRGHPDVRALAGGLDGWMAAGMPTVQVNPVTLATPERVGVPSSLEQPPVS
jgi:membrane protein DedA with SNARE-associated domain/rhodanese-related sulfurtransferase